MKYLGYVFAAMLAVIALLQLNDPDPVYWVATYALSAGIPLLQGLGRSSPVLAGVAAGMIVSGLIHASPGFFDYLQSGNFGSITGSMDGPDAYVEPAREFLGLLIALAIVIFYLKPRRSIKS